MLWKAMYITPPGDFLKIKTLPHSKLDLNFHSLERDKTAGNLQGDWQKSAGRWKRYRVIIKIQGDYWIRRSSCTG